MEITSARRKTHLHITRLRVGHDSWWLQHLKLCTFLVNKLRTKIVSNRTHPSMIAAKISSDLSVLDIMVMWSMSATYACESFNKNLISKREESYLLWEMLETDYGEELCSIFNGMYVDFHLPFYFKLWSTETSQMNLF